MNYAVTRTGYSMSIQQGPVCFFYEAGGVCCAVLATTPAQTWTLSVDSYTDVLADNLYGFTEQTHLVYGNVYLNTFQIARIEDTTVYFLNGESIVLDVLHASLLSDILLAQTVVPVSAITSVNGDTGPAVTLDTGDITSVLDKRYVTDAQLVVIGNTSGTNSGNETVGSIGALVNGATAAVPNDTDLVSITESSTLKKLTLTNLKAFLKTYFDTVYTTTSSVASQITTALSGYATQAWVTSQGYITSVVSALGFTPENVANKQTDLTASATKYPTVDAVNTGLSGKEPTLVAGTTGQYYRGDKSWQTLDKTAVGLGNVVNLDTSSTANITDSLNKRFVTDAQLTVLGNTSGTNTGNQTSIVGISGTKAQFDTACSDGNFLYAGDAVPYTGATSALNLGSQNLQTTGLLGIGEAPTAGIQVEISSNVNTDIQVEASLHHDSTASGLIMLRKSRGTHASPTSLNSADRLGFLGFSGYAGSAYVTSAAIIATAEEAFSAGTYGTGINFETATTGGGSPTRTPRMRVHANGNVSIGTNLTNEGFREDVSGNSRVCGSSDVTGNAYIIANLSKTPFHTFPNVGGQNSKAIATPATPAAGEGTIFIDSTAKILAIKDDAGVYKASSRNAAIAAQGAGFATDTYVTNSDLRIPSWGLQAKTTYLLRVSASKTAAGTATPIYNIRIGANRTTADTARLTLTGPAQTAIADIGTLWIMVTVRSVGAGTAAVIQGTAWWNHQGTAANTTTQGTGFANNGTGHVEGTSAGFDSSAMAGQYIGVSINGGTSAAWTLTQVQVEAQW